MIGRCVKIHQVGLRPVLHVPFRPVVAQGGATGIVYLDCGAMLEPGQFKAEGLSASARAEFDRIHQLLLLSITAQYTVQ
jgi:hypothetical protein